MKKQKIVHWDLDGTLLDSEPLHVKKLIHVARTLGVELTAEDFTKEHTFDVWLEDSGQFVTRTTALHGAGDKAIYYWACSKNKEIAKSYSLSQWLKDSQDYYIKHSDELGLRPGILECLKELRANKVVQHIVTNATHEQLLGCAVVMHLLKPFITYVITADDVSQHKPDPMSYLISAQVATQKYGLCEHYAVEDSVTGLKAALAAHMKAIHFLPAGVPSSTQSGVFSAQTAKNISEYILKLDR